MFATYGWSHSVEEMGNIFQLDLGLYSDYSEMNSSIVIVTNNSALMVSHLWTYEILSCIFILKEEKYDNLELKIKVLHYVCVQTACNKDSGCRGFFCIERFFHFLYYLNICKDVWVGQVLDQNRVSSGNPELIVQVPVLLASLFVRLFCSVFPAVCSGLKFVLSCVG